MKVSLRYQPIVLVVFFVTLLATIWLLFLTPKGFFPQEDIGQLSVSTEARQDISFDAMVALQQRAADVIRGSPLVANVASIIGSSGQSSGRHPSNLGDRQGQGQFTRHFRRKAALDALFRIW